MSSAVLRLYVKCKMLMEAVREDHGQDLVEYAAVISLVVLGITAGMSTLANGINDAMTAVGTKINTTVG